jgi:uncharacterized protein
VKYGNILLARLGEDVLEAGIYEADWEERFLRTSQDVLEFSVHDGRGTATSFIPLYRVEEETYTVYCDLAHPQSRSRSHFTFAQDGSAAYDEA